MATRKKSTWNDKTRNEKIMLIFFGAIIAIIAGIWIYSVAGSGKKEGSVRISKTQNNNKQQTANDVAYQKQLSDVNTKNAQQALQSGSSWISIPAYYSEAKPETADKPTQIKPLQRLKTPAVQTVLRKGEKPANEARKEAAEILKGLQASWTYSPPGDAAVSDTGDYAAMFVPEMVTSTSLNAAAPAVNPTVAPFKLFEAFDLCTAQLKTSLDTDTNSAVRAKLMCRELYSAMLYAPGYKLVGEDIDMTFTMMVFNKKTYAIQAKAVDLDTGRSMLTGDVNHRYFKRIVIPALALGVQKAGSLYEKASDNTTYVSNGTVVSQNSSKVEPNQVWGTFVGGIAEQTANVLKADNARVPPIQVTRPDQPTFGVMFIKPVMSTDVIDDKAVPTGDKPVATKPSPVVTTSANSSALQPYSAPAAQEQTNDQRQLLQTYSVAPTTAEEQYQPGPIFAAGIQQ